MSALARLLRSMGKRVGGCDREEGRFTRLLVSEGIEVKITDYCEQVDDFEAVVYTDAVGEGDRTLLRAKGADKPTIPRGELLSDISKLFRRTIAVSGSHGKSTCTAMLAHIFGAAELPFGCHIGADDLSFRNSALFGREYFITEACEYRQNFLRLRPQIGIVLNTQPDHLDCYKTVDNLKKAYYEFCLNSACVIKLYGELPKADGVTFGFDDRADYHAAGVRGTRGAYSFRLFEGKECLGEINLKIVGKHNVLNALAAVAAARLCGMSFETIRAGLENFCGLARRFERIGTINGIETVADYAHHPDEIKAALKTARQITDGRIFVVFQPHTYSRTKTLFNRFVDVLSNADKLLIYKTYAAREYFDDAGSALTLSRALKRSVYADGIEGICSFLSAATEGDLLLVLGAGDIYDVAVTLVDR